VFFYQNAVGIGDLQEEQKFFKKIFALGV